MIHLSMSPWKVEITVIHPSSSISIKHLLQMHAQRSLLSVCILVHMLTSDLSIKRGKKYHFYNYIDMLRQTDALPNTAPAPASVLLQ